MVCGLHGRPISTSHLYFPCRVRVFHQRAFTARLTHLGFSQEELQVPPAEDAVVLDVAREVHGAGAVHGAVHLHVAVDDVQVLLLVLWQTQREKRAVNFCSSHLTDRHSG